MRPYLKKISQKGLVEWLKVMALSSNPSTTKNKTNQNKNRLTPCTFYPSEEIPSL
jgi:hypothetical protein